MNAKIFFWMIIIHDDDATSDLLHNFHKLKTKLLEISNFSGMAKLERPKLTSKPVAYLLTYLQFSIIKWAKQRPGQSPIDVMSNEAIQI
jgi:hypothetical protein